MGLHGYCASKINMVPRVGSHPSRSFSGGSKGHFVSEESPTNTEDTVRQMSDEFWNHVNAAFDLSDDQTSRLREEVEEIAWQIHIHKLQQKRPSNLTRRERNAALRKLSNRFAQLEQEIENFFKGGSHNLEQFLSSKLSRSLTNDGFKDALGEDISWDQNRVLTEEYRKQSGDEGYAYLEEGYRDIRFQLASEQTSSVLVGHLRSLRRNIDGFRKLSALGNKGGSPGRIYRNYVIGQLLDAYPEIFGRRPTTSPEGHFAHLCELILEKLGESTKGTDEAVKRLLMKRSS